MSSSCSGAPEARRRSASALRGSRSSCEARVPAACPVRPFRIEVLATTDAATDPLRTTRGFARRDGRPRDAHLPSRSRVPRRAPGVARRDRALERLSGRESRLWQLHPRARGATRFFKALGATATDHAVVSPSRLGANGGGGSSSSARAGEATELTAALQRAHVDGDGAHDVEDGLVMQLHPGAVRDHNARVRAFGPDKGATSRSAPSTRAICAAAQRVRQRSAFPPRAVHARRVDVRARAGAARGALSGAAPRPPLVVPRFDRGNDALSEQVTETAGIYNTAGFNDDTRAFCSIPAGTTSPAASTRTSSLASGRAPSHRPG